MNEVKRLKRFMLEGLFRMGGQPLLEETLFDSCRLSFKPRPLDSDLVMVLRELEGEGYIIGQREIFDGTVSWALTTRGQLKAKELMGP